MSNKQIENLIESYELSINLIKKEVSRLRKLLTPVLQFKIKDHEINYKLLSKGLTNSKKPSKNVEKVEASSNLDKIGRAGEIAFQNYLHEILDLKFCSINWVNKVYETKKPYDFEVTIGDKIFYIDVKTTRGSQTTPFYLSGPELKFAKSKKEYYLVARLSQFDELNRYKADSFNVRMIETSKLDGLLKKFSKDPNYVPRKIK